MKYPLVVVKWVDSHHRSEGWQEIEVDQIKDEAPFILSAGWQVFLGTNIMVIVPHIDENDGDLSGIGELTIPMKSVVWWKRIDDPSAEPAF